MEEERIETEEGASNETESDEYIYLADGDLDLVYDRFGLVQGSA